MKIINVPLTIPNMLSLYRLFSFPFIMIFIFLGHEGLFSFFICFNLATDILDGWIARKFNQMTEIGAKIDGTADSGTFILALTGLFIFKWDYIRPYSVWLFVYIAVFFFSRLIGLLRHGILSGYHTYIARRLAYVQGSFFVVLFCIGFFKWFYYLTIISGIIVFTETTLITMLLKEPRSSVRSIYWLLKFGGEVE